MVHATEGGLIKLSAVLSSMAMSANLPLQPVFSSWSSGSLSGKEEQHDSLFVFSFLCFLVHC